MPDLQEFLPHQRLPLQPPLDPATPQPPWTVLGITFRLKTTKTNVVRPLDWQRLMPLLAVRTTHP